MNQLKTLAVSIHSVVSLPRAFYFLEYTWEQKEAGKYISLYKQDELNQPTSIN